MTLNLIKYIICVWLAIGIASCRQAPKQKKQQIVTTKEMVANNRKSVRMESGQIDKFIERRAWDMIKTGSGLRYMIYERGNSEISPKVEDTVYVEYEVSLINGKTIYVSDSNNLASFIVGYDQVENGLQEGIQYMVPGDKAKFIIPSHLAHGYTGDFNRIPKNSTVIFDISLIQING